MTKEERLNNCCPYCEHDPCCCTFPVTKRAWPQIRKLQADLAAAEGEIEQLKVECRTKEARKAQLEEGLIKMGHRFRLGQQRIAELEEKVGSWRRVAEKLEREKQALKKKGGE